MKILIIFTTAIICVVKSESSPSISNQDANKPASVLLKSSQNPLNTIPAVPKQIFYQPVKYQAQPQPQYVPIQLVPRPYYMQQFQPQPQAMIIIAQPALLPSSLVYGGHPMMQQLLNYFQNNPQAKYQLLHGNPQQVQQVQHVQQVAPAASLGNYVIAAAPVPVPIPSSAPAPVAVPIGQYQTQTITPAAQYQQQLQAQQLQAQQQQLQAQQHQLQAQQQQVPQQQQANQLGHIAHLAQLAAQQYVSSPMKAAPAIVTGFENFTPEQQAHIKAQLGAQLGTNFHAVGAEKQFVPSQQILKNEGSSASTSTTNNNNSNNGGSGLKTQYNKG